MKKILFLFVVIVQLTLTAQVKVSEISNLTRANFADSLQVLVAWDSSGTKVSKKFYMVDLESFMRDSLLIAGSITDAMLNGSITLSKLTQPTGNDAQVLIWDKNGSGVLEYHELTGDITLNADGVNVIGSSKITSSKILDRTIATADIDTGAVTANEIASNSVTTAKILDANVTNNKLALAVNSYSANQTLTTSNYYVNVTTSTTDKTITLPITSIIDGTTFHVKKADSGVGWVIISVSGGGTIDGVSSLSIQYQYSGYTLVKSGNNYLIYGVF